MADNEAHGGPPGTAQADRLYRGFPDFSAWGPLSPEDADLWSRFAASLAEMRQAATPAALKNAVDVAIRAAALDTGAIEGLYNVDRGFTMTVAVQGLAWQQMVEERGAGVRELFEAQLAAYELVLDAVTHKMPITEAWIRALHETLCAPQKTYRVFTDQGWQEQELPKGDYKSRPNHVRLTDGTMHAYAPVDLVPTEMHRLVEQIRTPEFEAAHPVLQASYCHYAFVVIHPFADGNGRVARALASTFFYRAQSIPLMIFANQRPAYLDALALADRDDHHRVISFFLDRGIDTMQVVSDNLRTASTPNLPDLASQLNRFVKNVKNLSSGEVYDIQMRMIREIARAFDEHVGLLKLPGFSSFTKPFFSESSPAGFDQNGTGYRQELYMSRNSPKPAFARLTLSLWFNKDYRFPFLLRSEEDSDHLEIRFEDIYPEFTPQLRLRLDQWTQRQLGRILSELARQSDLGAS
jgi:Fic family protein